MSDKLKDYISNAVRRKGAVIVRPPSDIIDVEFEEVRKPEFAKAGEYTWARRKEFYYTWDVVRWEWYMGFCSGVIAVSVLVLSMLAYYGAFKRLFY